MKELFKVHHQLIGAEMQEHFANTTIAIVGLGGLGSCVAQSLNRTGIGHLVLIDPDTVEESNLPRQSLYTHKDIGRLKVEAAKDILLQFKSNQTITIFSERLQSSKASLLSSADLVVDCTDNFVARFTISKACAVLGIPMIFGAVNRFEGQVGVFNYKGSLPFHEVFPDLEMLLKNETCDASGVLPFVVLSTANLQVAEVFKIISKSTEVLNNKLLTLDFETSKSRILDLS